MLPLNRRIAAARGTSHGQGEPLQLLPYEPGNEYRAHVDALPGEQNQRIITVSVYLTEGYQGGDTHFLRTGLSYKGAPPGAQPSDPQQFIPKRTQMFLSIT